MDMLQGKISFSQTPIFRPLFFSIAPTPAPVNLQVHASIVNAQSTVVKARASPLRFLLTRHWAPSGSSCLFISEHSSLALKKTCSVKKLYIYNFISCIHICLYIYYYYYIYIFADYSLKQNAMTSQMFGITFCLWEVSSRSLMPLLPEATRRFYPFTQTQDPPAEKKPPLVTGWIS